MRIFDVKGNVGASGEFILGAEQTGSHACYLIYGTMKPKERERELKPGKGHEELLLALRGDFIVTGHATGTVRQSQAIYLKEDEVSWLENATDSEGIYVISGGHSDTGHH